MKECAKCHQLKPLTEFYAKKDSKDGKTTRCKTCTKEDRKDTYDTKINGERCTQYREAHKEELREKYKDFYKDNRDKILQRSKDYYLSHLEEKKAYHKQYNKTHPHKPKKYAPGQRRKWSRKSADRLWQHAIEFFGPCACCGESHREFLSVDHIKGNGGYHRRKEGWKGGGKAILQKLRKEGWPEKAKNEYRLLCFNCNFAIGHHGYCPHHPEIRYPNQCFKEEKYNGDEG